MSDVGGNPENICSVRVFRRLTQFGHRCHMGVKSLVRLAAGIVELIITLEGLPRGGHWQMWRGPPLGEMVLNF
jgi:hypothetical protein